MYVTCVKGRYAGLTEGRQYKVYGSSTFGVIVRNDFGLLLTYTNEFFG